MLFSMSKTFPNANRSFFLVGVEFDVQEGHNFLVKRREKGATRGSGS